MFSCYAGFNTVRCFATPWLVNPLTATVVIWGRQTNSNFPVTSKIMRIWVVYFLIGNASHIILHNFSFCCCRHFFHWWISKYCHFCFFFFFFGAFAESYNFYGRNMKKIYYLHSICNQGGWVLLLSKWFFKFQFKCIFIWAEIVASLFDDSG